MTRTVLKLALAAFFFTGSSVGVWVYLDQRSSQRQIAKLEQEKKQLERAVQRLSTEKRVAEIVVLDQKTIEGVLQSTLLFVESDKNGRSLPSRTFVVRGTMIHINAMVIKFEHDFIKSGDPLRGHSIALFTRIYGDHQSPNEGYPIDTPGQMPQVYRDADPNVTEFELDLWKNFWRLVDDPTYRANKGVRIAQGEGPWGPFEPGKLYTITLESAGGLNIASQPLTAIQRELLRTRNVTDSR
jgi:hypothetical protein